MKQTSKIEDVDENIDSSSIESQADDIALNLIKLLVENFKAKEGRDPDSEEIEDLFGELTEERIQELLGESTNDEKQLKEDQSELKRKIDSKDDSNTKSPITESKKYKNENSSG